MNNASRGRIALQKWESSKPDNFFIADHNLQSVLKHYMGDAAYGAQFEQLVL